MNFFVRTQLKSIIKECKTPKYSSKLKQALLKIEENYNYLNNERNKININLREIDKIKAFEVDIKAKGTPLQKYLDQYKKSQNLVKAKRVADENARVRFAYKIVYMFSNLSSYILNYLLFHF